MPSAVFVVDPAALQVAEEAVLWLECTKLGAGLVVANAGAIAVDHVLEAGEEVHDRIGG